MRESAAQSNTKKQNAAKSVGARRRLRIWLTFMILFMGWASYTYIAQSGEIGDKSHQLAERQASKEQHEQTLEQLKYEINRLKDPEYIGQIAMKKYGLFKPGEIPLRISESDPGKD